ncbi:MAG: PLP-dependent aminotransferase family protein [Firmicutes bacterium]|nr:PLP-dependent aminotransferase family protein [Bacillota bacterium]
MEINWQEFYARRTRQITGSQIRQFFALTERPEIISFAGGFPASDFFPREEIGRVLGELACAENSHALQYAPTEGNHDLRAYLAAKIRCAGSACHIDNIIITNGSQQGLDLLCRILVNPGDPVLVEEPAYVGGMGAIKSYGGVPAGIPMDGEGPLPAAMEKTILKLERQGRHPRLFYTVTNFHNPTGYTTSLARRKAILALAEDYNIVIIEDNPYGELCYEGTVPPNYQALDRSGRVIYLGSYSKIFIPGIRIGWMAAPQAVIEKVCLAKQTADLCSNSLGQRLAYRLSAEGFIDRHVKKLICFYRKNRDAMLETMERCFPPEINFTRPQGGFFVWVQFPPFYPPARELLHLALEQGVAFVHGEGFFSGAGGSHAARFSFSQVSPEKIAAGISRLGKLFYRFREEDTRQAAGE